MKYIREFNNYNRMNENSSGEFQEELGKALVYMKKYFDDVDNNSHLYNLGEDEIYNYKLQKKSYYNFIETDFPRGLQNIPDPVKLYRILKVNNIKDIRKDNLGKHYVGDPNLFYDDGFLDSIGILKNFKEYFYVIEINTPLININIRDSIFSKYNFPDEYEYIIKDSTNIEIVDITKFEMK